MDEFEDMDVSVTFLPGVDLALWTRIAVVLTVTSGLIAAALLYL